MAYWLTFTDGATACVARAASQEHAKDIGRQHRGLVVVKVESLPYPAAPCLDCGPDDWTLCIHPAKCAGRGSCPRDIACSE